VHAVRGVSFALRAGEILALIGPNGAGKSTCFNMLNGQLAPDAGIVRLGGRDIVGLRPRAVWRLGVGRTFQTAATFASMSARENVQLALLAGAGEYGTLKRRLDMAQRSEADALLTRVGAGSLAEQVCASLSYADVKRVELAMALGSREAAPRLLLMDEPTSALDVESEAQVVASLFALMRGRTTLMVAHRLTTIRRVDKILVVDSGRLTEMGAPEDLLAEQGYYARVVGGQLAL